VNSTLARIEGPLRTGSSGETLSGPRPSGSALSLLWRCCSLLHFVHEFSLADLIDATSTRRHHPLLHDHLYYLAMRSSCPEVIHPLIERWLKPIRGCAANSSIRSGDTWRRQMLPWHRSTGLSNYLNHGRAELFDGARAGHMPTEAAPGSS
jgi:hypothetical protein